MGLSRSEIQLIINAQNKAQGAFDQLNTQVKAVTGQSAQASQAMQTFGTKTQGTGVAAQATGVAVGLLAERLGRGLVSGFQSTIAAANRLDSGLIGLSSVAKAFGGQADAAQAAAKRLAADGLMSVGEAATGLKNLLASGFNLDQATTLMERFKDSASFGRQAALDFGQAITSATEGVKNGNSILVDNAGVTKNLSQILVEAGFSAQDLSKAASDAGVRMAIFNGIVKETKPQLGDTAKFLETAAGKQAQFNAQIEIAQQKIGKALQPALASVLTVLQPVVAVIGALAPVIVPVGIAIAGLVAPIMAAKAAAVLGVSSLADLTAAFGATGAAAMTAGEEVQAASVLLYGANGKILTTADGLSSTTVAAGKAATSFGTLGTAVAAGGVAMAAWQFGRWIADITGLDKVVEDLWSDILGTGEAAKQTSEDVKAWAIQTARLHGLKVDEIELSKQYGAAVKYNMDLDAIRTAKILADQQKLAESTLKQYSTEASLDMLRKAGLTEQLKGMQQRAEKTAEYFEFQKRGILAELDLGRITKETANARLAEIAGEERAAQVTKNRISLTDSVRIATQAVQNEIKATGLTLGDMTKALAKNADGFEKWANANHLSAETIDYVKDQLKKQQDAADKATEAAKKQIEAQQQVRQELEQIGIVTRESVSEALKAMAIQEEQAAREGVDFVAVLRAQLPALDDLALKAQNSGVHLDALSAAWQRAHDVINLMDFGTTGPPPDFTSGIIVGNDANAPLGGTAVNPMKSLELNTYLATRALEQFGITSQKAYRAAADAAILGYNNIVRVYGKNSKEAQEAHQKMIDAMKLASGDLLSFWNQTMFPAILNGFNDISQGVSHTFGDMLLGLTKFKDGFTSIWQGIKRSLSNILGDILDGFIKKFLGGMMSSMQNSQEGFGQMFAGMFTGGTQATGSSGGGFSAGGFGGAFAMSGINSGGSGGLFSQFTSQAGLRSAGLMGAVAGIQWMVQQSQAARTDLRVPSTGSLVASGALTGASIGTMIMPGWGTLIGAGVGAAAGYARSRLTNFTSSGRTQFAQDQGYANVDEMIAALRTQSIAQGIGPNVADELLNRARHVIGQRDESGNRQWVNDVTAAFQAIEDRANRTQTALQRYNLTWDDMTRPHQEETFRNMAQGLLDDGEALERQGYRHDAVLRRQADDYSTLLKNAKKYNLELPAAMRPVLEEMIRMGLLVDDNGNKLEDLNGFSFAPAIAVWDEFGQTGEEVTQKMKHGLDGVADSLRGVTEEARRAKGGLDDLGNATPRHGGAATASTGTPGTSEHGAAAAVPSGGAAAAAVPAGGMTVVINANGVDSRVDSWRRFLAEGGVAELIDHIRRSGADRADMQLALGIA